MEFDSNFQFDHNFNLPPQLETESQHEATLNSTAPKTFFPYQHVSVSQTLPPFRTTHSQVSDFRQFNTDSQVSGKKLNGKEKFTSQLEGVTPGTSWNPQFGVRLTE
jgi:hypothetical protein